MGTEPDRIYMVRFRFSFAHPYIIWATTIFTKSNTYIIMKTRRKVGNMYLELFGTSSTMKIRRKVGNMNLELFATSLTCNKLF